MFIKKILILFLLFFSILFGIGDLSIYDKYDLAQSYKESKMYEDAILIYEEILLIQQHSLGYTSPHLLKILNNLYELNILITDIDNAKKYLQKYLDVQYAYILEQQNNYINPLNKLKDIYTNEKKDTD